MQSDKRSIRLTALLAIVTATVVMAGPHAAAQAERVLHSFNNNGKDGVAPYAGLIVDAAGNLYGTTHVGGAYGGGTVFELSPKAGGGWTETVIYAFGNGTDGVFPSGSLIRDALGSLYGTTSQGNGAYSGGTAFQLTPTAGGGWTETVIHVFGNGTDGARPIGSLIFDASGNLYGTTTLGGAQNLGTVFELAPAAGGGWTESVLHAFANLSNGFNPVGGLVFDTAGNLYGTTFLGAVAFELRPTAGGSWEGGVIHFFSNLKDGFNPNGSLIFDASGNLYGTAGSGGANPCGGAGCGTVFELSPRSGGGWTEKILHSFNNNGTDGYTPSDSVIFDAAGNLYGVTGSGGNNTNCGNGASCGTAFELVPTASGHWREKILHNFSNDGKDGTVPQGRLLLKGGSLYGTTIGGGTYGYGTVFVIKP